MADFYF